MKRMMITIAALALLAGCGKNPTEKKPSVPKGERTYEQLATNEVLLIANGAPLTKGAVELQVAVQSELAKIANPNVKLSDLKRQEAKNRRRAQKLFIEQRAMLAEAERRGIQLTAADRKEIRDRFAKSVLKGKGKSKYGILTGMLDAEKRGELDAGLNREKLVQMTVAAMREECKVEVSTPEAERKFKDIEAYNARGRAEEAQIWKSASNAWERIRCGEPFEKTAARCTAASEHVNSDMDWGEFELEFFKGDAALCHYLEVMPVGTVTPPVPGDNGLLIVKMLAKSPVDFGAGQLRPRYRLAKIFFELPEYYELGTVEELRKEMEKGRTDEALKSRIDALVAAVKVEYPNGKVELAPGRESAFKLTGGRGAKKQSADKGANGQKSEQKGASK